MAESKDEETRPEDKGHKRKALKGKERDALGERLECSPPWESSAHGDTLSRIHCFNSINSWDSLTAAVGTAHTFHSSAQPSHGFTTHTFLLLSCGREQRLLDSSTPPTGEVDTGFPLEISALMVGVGLLERIMRPSMARPGFLKCTV